MGHASIGYLAVLALLLLQCADLKATATVPQYAYSGREGDASGLVYYRGRYLDAASGRFTQRDPIGLAGGIQDYGYVDGNPSNRVDPSGTSASLVQRVAKAVSYFVSTPTVAAAERTPIAIISRVGSDESDEMNLFRTAFQFGGELLDKRYANRISANVFGVERSADNPRALLFGLFDAQLAYERGGNKVPEQESLRPLIEAMAKVFSATTPTGAMAFFMAQGSTEKEAAISVAEAFYGKRDFYRSVIEAGGELPGRRYKGQPDPPALGAPAGDVAPAPGRKLPKAVPPKPLKLWTFMEVCRAGVTADQCR